VSGVYYAAVPKGSAPLVLRKPIEFEGEEETEGDVCIYPREGQLVIFPPWVMHGVPTMQSNDSSGGSTNLDSPRVSYAFNVSGAYLGNPWGLTKMANK